MNSNRKNGTAFESEFANILADNGFWVHQLAQTQAGQPADIVAVKGDFPVLIDCKVMSGTRFPLSRIEPNQVSAMNLWDNRVTTIPYFAIKLPDGQIRMVMWYVMKSWMILKKASVSIEEITYGGHSMALEDWLKEIVQ